MNIEEARNEFAVRLYNWAKSDFVREINDGLPLISSMKASSALRFREAIADTEIGEQMELARAAPKSSHKTAIELTSEQVSPSERELLERFRELMARYSPLELEAIERKRREDPQSLGRRKGLAALYGTKFSKNKFTTLARDRLPAVIGTEVDGAGTFDLCIGNWTLRTYVRWANPPHYIHRSIFAQSGLRVMDAFCDYLRVLGIGGLEWDLLFGAQDMREAADSMCKVCSHFVQALPSLLKGIDISDPPPAL